MEKIDRSNLMSRIRSKNTAIEMTIRRGLHEKGLRYRLHDSNLPGKPDIVFPKYKAVVLVNGCFWHGHNCHLFRTPKTNVIFWSNKIKKNIERDKENIKKLDRMGWRILIIWECSFKGKYRMNQVDLVLKIYAWIISGAESTQIQGAVHEKTY